MLLLPLKKILWPTDFSDCSYVALSCALELADHFKAELHIVHIIPAVPRPIGHTPDESDAYQIDLGEYEAALHTNAQQKMHEVVTQRIPATQPTRQIVGHGDAPSEIARLAEDDRVDLIVITTHGMTGWRNVAFGSVAERVVRLATRPVLSIRAPCKPS